MKYYIHKKSQEIHQGDYPGDCDEDYDKVEKLLSTNKKDLVTECKNKGYNKPIFCSVCNTNF
jgi:hypothetical protein